MATDDILEEVISKYNRAVSAARIYINIENKNVWCDYYETLNENGYITTPKVVTIFAKEVNVVEDDKSVEDLKRVIDRVLKRFK